MAKKRLPRAKLLRRLQDLVGQAKSDYQNDRSSMRADKVVPALEEAFDICVQLREKYKA